MQLIIVLQYLKTNYMTVCETLEPVVSVKAKVSTQCTPTDLPWSTESTLIHYLFGPLSVHPSIYSDQMRLHPHIYSDLLHVHPPIYYDPLRVHPSIYSDPLHVHEIQEISLILVYKLKRSGDSRELRQISKYNGAIRSRKHFPIEFRFGEAQNLVTFFR